MYLEHTSVTLLGGVYVKILDFAIPGNHVLAPRLGPTILVLRNKGRGHGLGRKCIPELPLARTFITTGFILTPQIPHLRVEIRNEPNETIQMPSLVPNLAARTHLQSIARSTSDVKQRVL